MNINYIFKKNTAISRKTTFRKYTDYYLQNVAKLYNSELTFHKNKGVIKSEILPVMGDMKLDEITPIFVSKFLYDLSIKQTKYKNIENHPLAFSTVNRIKATLSSILQSAVDMQILDINPCRNIKINNHKSFSHSYNYYDKNTYLKVMKLLKDEDLPHRLIIELALKTGLRKSEIWGLTWDDIDLKNNTIDINKSRNYISGTGMIVKATKNKSSIRTIYIAKSLCVLLKDYYMMYGKNTYVFEKINFNTISLWFKNWQLKNGIVPIKFHDLRHTHATLLLEQGIDAKTISSRLGHSSITTTLNIYAHVLKDLDKNAVQKIEELEYKKTETN